MVSLIHPVIDPKLKATTELQKLAEEYSKVVKQQVETRRAAEEKSKNTAVNGACVVK